MAGLIVIHPTNQPAFDELNERIKQTAIDYLQKGQPVYHLLNARHVHEFHGYLLNLDGVEEISCEDSFREQLDELEKGLHEKGVKEAHLCGIYKGGGQCVDGVKYSLERQQLKVGVLEELCG